MRAILYLVLLAAFIAAFYIYFKPGSQVTETSSIPVIEEGGSIAVPKKHPEPETVKKADDALRIKPYIKGEESSPERIELSHRPENTGTLQRNTSDIFEKAVRRFDSGDYRTSLSLFMEIKETDARALTGTGLSYFKLGDFSNAVRYLEEAIADGEDNFIERKFLALAYYKSDELEKSVANAESALDRKNDPELTRLLGKLKRERDTQETFINEETMHFKVVFDGYVHGNISRKILDLLENAYRDIGNELNHFPDGTITVLLYTEKDFFDITRLPAWTAGAYDGKIRLPVRGIESMDEQFLRIVMYHEYVHAAVHSMTSRMPLWMNEGLAEYLVNRGFEKTGQTIPLRSLEREFPMHDQRLMTAAYMESYSAVSFLVEEHGLYRIKEFMESLSTGTGLNDAFMYAFYISYDEFVSTWGRN